MMFMQPKIEFDDKMGRESCAFMFYLQRSHETGMTMNALTKRKPLESLTFTLFNNFHPWHSYTSKKQHILSDVIAFPPRVVE